MRKSVSRILRGIEVRQAGITLVVMLAMAGAGPGALAQGQYIDLFPMTQADIELIFETLDSGVTDLEPSTPPVVMMLHGPQAAKFVRSAYSKHRNLIEHAAKLSAFGMLDIKICEMWLKETGHSRQDLFPFITPVPYGADELTRLREEESYSEFVLDI